MKELKGMKIELPEGFELRQEGDTYKVVNKEFKLKEGGDYKCIKDEDVIIIDRTEKGWDCPRISHEEGFTLDGVCLTPEEWREATKEEVIEAFEKECIRRYGENWKEVELEECMYHGYCYNTYTYYINIYKYDGGWIVWNNHGCLYYKGKWAKKKEVEYAEDLKDIDRPYFINMNGCVRTAGYQTPECLPTRELGEGVLALIQLLSFRQDIWDKGGKPENGKVRYGIHYISTNSSLVVSRQGPHGLLYFKTKEQAEYFLYKHKDLIIEYLNNLK